MRLLKKINEILELIWLSLLFVFGAVILLSALVLFGLPALAALILFGFWTSVPDIFSCLWSQIKDAAREIKIKAENFFSKRPDQATNAQLKKIYDCGEAMASVLEKARLGKERRTQANKAISEFRRSIAALK